MNRLDELSALRDNLHEQVRSLDVLIRELSAVADEDRRALARFELGNVWGATKLARYLGVSENTARKVMLTELADVTWLAEGRLRVNAPDVERWMAAKGRAA